MKTPEVKLLGRPLRKIAQAHSKATGNGKTKWSPISVDLDIAAATNAVFLNFIRKYYSERINLSDAPELYAVDGSWLATKEYYCIWNRLKDDDRT